MEDKPKVARMPFLDDLRGLGVVAMFVWHTTDAWLRPALKAGEGFTGLRIFGGMAAPLFLFLAGAAGALKLMAAERAGRPVAEARRQLAARGAGVVCVGYGLRLSMWMIDGSALIHLNALPIWLPQLVGLTLLWLATEDWGRGRPRAKLLAVAGLALWALGIAFTVRWVPHKIPGLFRVDVLQSIGSSLILIAILGPYLDLPRRIRATLFGAAVLLVTLPLGELLPGPLPGAVAGYIAAWPIASGARSMAMFPLAPWLGYAFFGVAFGATVGRPLSPAAWRRSLTLAVCFCASLGALASAAIPELGALTYALPSSAKLIRAIHRVGLAVSTAGLLKLLEGPLAYSPLRVFGKTSLLLYCVHLEFAYGAAARPLAHRLSYVEWLLGLFLLMGMMYGLGRLRLRLGHRARRSPSRVPREDPKNSHIDEAP